MSESAFQQCIQPDCGHTLSVRDVAFRCSKCASLLDVRYEWDRVEVPKSLSFFEKRWSSGGRSLEALADFSGVWRFRQLFPFADLESIVTIGEGRTLLQQADGLAGHLGMKAGSLFLQYEGFNPSGSFKDNGMTAAITVARMLNRRRVACASTGNTSASMALFASLGRLGDGSPMQAIVFIGSGKIAYGKFSQALDHGALTLQVAGDFDTCMQRVGEATDRLGVYLMNSLNPFRLEGQKSIIYRILQGLNWQVPDWIVVPGGNLGNTSAFGKALHELRELGLIDRMPRLAVINAAGASTLYELFERKGLRWNGGQIDRSGVDKHYAAMADHGWRAQTVASAIEIGKPVNLTKALRSLDWTDGVVRQVDDPTILEHKALIGRHGYGCEPASAASVAGLRQLLAEQVIGKSDRVVCILTGHLLKDPNATVAFHMDEKGQSARSNQPVPVADDIEAICRVIEQHTAGGD
jgi:threonine synthase